MKILIKIWYNNSKWLSNLYIKYYLKKEDFKMKKMEISKKVVQRLTEYLSILKEVRKYEKNINSIKLSKIMNTTSAQVRKDLSTFGEFGVRGKGYDIDNLIEIIENL